MAKMTFELGKHKTVAKKHTNYTGYITPRRVKSDDVIKRINERFSQGSK